MGRLLIFDIKTWVIQRELSGHEALSPANRCCFLMPSASSDLAACGDETGKVYIWEYRHSKGALLPEGPLCHQGNVINNGRHLKKGKVKSELTIPSNVNCVTFHPTNDSILVTAGDDGMVRVFKSESYLKSESGMKEIKESMAISLKDQKTLDRLKNTFR